MVEERVQLRLSAIFAADVVGSSPLMRADEARDKGDEPDLDRPAIPEPVGDHPARQRQKRAGDHEHPQQDADLTVIEM